VGYRQRHRQGQVHDDGQKLPAGGSCVPAGRKTTDDDTMTEGVTIMMKKNRVRILSLLLAAMLALSACGSQNNNTPSGGGANEPAAAPDAAPSEPAQQPAGSGEPIKDLVTFQTQNAEMSTFLILNSESQFDLNVLCNAYAPLLETDNKGKLIPAVAKEWGSDDGGLTWTFKLRDDVTWVDVNGNKKADCTAQDWLTAMEWILNYHKNNAENTSMPIAMIAGAEEYYEYTKALDQAQALALSVQDGPFLETVGVEAPDDYTLVYHCSKNAPYFDTLCVSACLYPLSQALVDELGAENVLSMNNNTMWYSGPYTITEFIMGNSKVFTKNDSYWDKDCTLFDTVTVRMLEDGNQDDVLFQTGEVDHTSLSESNLRIIYDDPNNEFHDNLVPSRVDKYSYQIFFNFAKRNEDGTMDENWNKAAANEAFRKSLYYGMDLTNYWYRTDMVNPASCENLAFTMKGLLYYSDGTDYVEHIWERLGYPDGVGRYDAAQGEQYKKQAMEELTAAGVTFPVEMDYYIKSGDQVALDTGTVLKEIFESLGSDYIQFNIKEYVSSASKEVYNPGLHSVLIRNWGADYGDPENFLAQMLYGVDNAWHSNTSTHINDATDPDLIAVYQEFTKMAQDAGMIYEDMDARYDAYADAEAYMIDHVLCIPLYYKTGWELTHINDYSKMYAMYGIQNYTYKNWETSTEAYTAADYEQFLAEFNAE